jgi:hypothetical protein
MKALFGLTAALLLAVGPARADFEIKFFLNDPTMAGAPALDIVDGGAGDSFPGTPGFIGYNGPVGALVNLQFSLSLSNSPGGSIGIITTSASEIRNLANAPTNLTIFVSGNDFTAPASPPSLEVDGTASGTLKGRSTGFISGVEQFASGSISASYTNYTDASNALFGTGFSSATFNQSVAGISKSFGGSIADTATPGFNTFGPYSISNLTQLNLGAEDVVVGFNASTNTINPIPEPGGFVLAFAGLLGIGLRRFLS